MIIKNAFVLNDEFHFVHADVYTDGRIITAIRMAGTAGAAEEPEQEIIDAYGSYLIPGLIDIHSHGAVGCDHLDGAIESTSAICQYMAAKGTTSILATIMTQSCEKMENACRNVAEYNGKLRDGAHVRGIYLEGPFFTEKYKEQLKTTSKYIDLNSNRIKIKAEYIYVQNTIIIHFLG